MPVRNRTALPEEIVGRTTRARLLAIVGGTAALVLLANLAAVWVLGHYPVNQAHRVIAAKWRLLESQDRPVDWLVLGDSSGNHGVVPGLLGPALGGSALNLCTVGSLAVVGDSWMLESYLRRVGRPRGVLLVHAYDVWRREVSTGAVAQVPLPFGFWSRMHPPVGLGAVGAARIALDRYAPLYAQDQSLFRLIRHPRETLGRRFDMDEGGYVRSKTALPEEVVKDAALHLERVATSEFELSDGSRRALEAIAAMAREHGFTVFIANGPLYEGLFRDPAFRAYHERLRRTVGEFARAHPPLRFLDADPMTFRAEEMTNADHLIDSSAARYTEFLASLSDLRVDARGLRWPE